MTKLQEQVKVHEKLWKNSKKAADKGAKDELARLKKLAKGDKEDLEEMKQLSKNYDALKKKFKLGLSPMLKKTINAKDAQDQIKFATEAKAIVIKYIAATKSYETKYTTDSDGKMKLSRMLVPNPQKTIVTLSAALEKINRGLDSSIAFANKLSK